MTNIDTLKLAEAIEDYVIDIRRDLHENPEVSGEEVRTMKLIIGELDKLNLKYETVPNGGIISIIEGEQPGKSIVLRGDIDALPMREVPTNLQGPRTVISKTDHAAHMCGHDGHTAMLLGAAKILAENKDKIRGKVILAFEQGEEKWLGITNLMERLVKIGADGVWGIHLKADMPSGKISVDPGPRMAGSTIFNVIIKGKGGHGSRPDLAATPLDVFTDLYTNLKSMRMNTLDPFQAITFSIGSVHAGTVENIIPEDLQFSGTFRFLHYEQGVRAEKEFKRLLEKLCDLHHCTFEYVVEPKAKDLLVHNQADCAAIAKEAVIKALGEHAVAAHPAWMASESFAFYQKYFPGTFAFLGVENPDKGTGADNHNPHFDIDEDVLKLGVASTVQYALDFLNHDKEIDFAPEQRTVKKVATDAGLEIID
ncbi:amidohydrolase [Oceanobacillus sp. FSL H7-0719]|uniref:amidohydrolase n=1 Tax=Oceanobacillus sp. FSL H7-0719 TaxID=2954507 RepID=UPI003246ECA1